MNPHCRIRSICRKESPHLIEVLPRPRSSKIAKSMRENAGRICEAFSNDLAGMVIVGWGFDGTWSRAVEIHQDSNVGQTMLPSFVADILRRDTMRAEFIDAFEWID